MIKNLWRKLFPVKTEYVVSRDQPVPQLVYYEGSVLAMTSSGVIYEITKDPVYKTFTVQKVCTLDMYR